MSAPLMKQKPSLQEHCLAQEQLVFQCTIVHNAVPANKQFSPDDLSGVLLLRAQGQTAAVDAVETLTWTAPTDNTAGNSVFGLYLSIGTTITPSLGPVPTMSDYADRVYVVRVSDPAGHTLSVTGPNAVANAYLTPLGNIAIEIAATALNLATTDVTLNVEVSYRNAKA